MGIIGNTIEVGKAMFEAIQADNASLRQENASLRQENASLRQENDRLKAENLRMERLADAVANEGVTGLYRINPRDW